jgi:hypothetical protein
MGKDYVITLWWDMQCNKVLYSDIIAIWDYMCVWAHIYEYLILLCKIGCDSEAHRQWIWRGGGWIQWRGSRSGQIQRWKDGQRPPSADLEVAALVLQRVRQIRGGVVEAAGWGLLVAKPPKLYGPHAPVIVPKTSDGYACIPDKLKSLSGVLGKPESSTFYNSHRINIGVTTTL